MKQFAGAALLLGSVLAGAPPACAQSSPFVGTWVVEQEVRLFPDASPQKVQARLVLAQRADSIFGKWTMQLPGRDTTTVELRGLPSGNSVALSGPPASGTVNGRTIDVAVTYSLRVAGDSITGEIRRVVPDGSVEIPPTPLRGTRRH